MKTNITHNTKAIILALVVTIGAGYAAAQNFTGPNCAPPGCNTPAPINVGSAAQSKTGLLNLAQLSVANLKISNPDGSFTAIPTGSVLTAIGAANTGTVGWVTPGTAHAFGWVNWSESISDKAAPSFACGSKDPGNIGNCSYNAFTKIGAVSCDSPYVLVDTVTVAYSPANDGTIFTSHKGYCVAPFN